MTAVERYLAERIGLRVDGATRSRVKRAATAAARSAGCPEPALVDVLSADPDRERDLIDRVTVQESGFFRHPEQFDLLADHLRALEGPGVIWSAGCANGQEAWSLAMLLEEHALAGWTVLATDVSAAAQRRAEAGEYAERELRALSALRRRRFVHDGAIAARLRRRVRFMPHNVAQAGPPAEAGDCRVVLCRNVLIYLHRPAIEGFLDALHRRMPPDGLLLIGAGEALGPLDGFRPGATPGAFVRRASLPSGGSAPGAAARPGPLPPVSVLLAEGNGLAAGGDLEAAARCFRQAGFLEPEDPRPRARLAAVLEEIARRS